MDHDADVLRRTEGSDALAAVGFFERYLSARARG